MKLLFTFSLITLLLSPITHADIWSEREALASIETEIESLEELVISAKNLSNKKNRTQFEYRVLLDDLKKIRLGISHHLTAPMEPVVSSYIDVLSATYTEHQ